MIRDSIGNVGGVVFVQQKIIEVREGRNERKARNAEESERMRKKGFKEQETQGQRKIRTEREKRNKEFIDRDDKSAEGKNLVENRPNFNVRKSVVVLLTTSVCLKISVCQQTHFGLYFHSTPGFLPSDGN
ncbi:hypothetical protein BaRGS_00026804 [Batillaria attramentaria]|uniref:Uncharacterized protein n=1 Tax=Batillaria attramentaria TaxID=370345 RepID=A0ABD0K3U9_9CAEN